MSVEKIENHGTKRTKKREENVTLKNACIQNRINFCY